MHRVWIAVPLLLAACATTENKIPVRGSPGERECVAKDTERFIGQPGTSDTGAQILKATGSSVLRWAPMGYMLTMDYRTDRVTVRLGPDRRVLSVSCG
jgi:hypothetical protein